MEPGIPYEPASSKRKGEKNRPPIVVTREEAHPKTKVTNTRDGGTTINSMDLEQSLMERPMAEDNISDATAFQVVQYLQQMKQTHDLDYAGLFDELCEEPIWSDVYLEKIFAGKFSLAFK